MNVESKSKDVLDFWNSRAALGLAAGTNDVIAKRLEVDIIAENVADGMKVLDAGCGNGVTAVVLAERFNIDIIGMDYAVEMVKAARESAAGRTIKGKIEFVEGSVAAPPFSEAQFDLVYTERTLINLESWDQQLSALNNLAALVVPGGRLMLCENSQDGLDKINQFRAEISLPPIKAPWHNRYFHDGEVNAASINGLELERVDSFSSTYYFLSRVINAWLAKEAGVDPEYEAPINKLALQLPPIGDFGQAKLWVWRKTEK